MSCSKPTRYKQALSLAVALLLVGSAQATSAEVVLVVSEKTPVSSLSANQVADIFLGKTDELPNGAPIVPVDQSDSSNAKEEFYKHYTNRTLSQIRAYWSKQIFTGKGEPPKQIGDNEQLAKFLLAYPNTIGYLEREKLTGGLKIVTVKKE